MSRVLRLTPAGIFCPHRTAPPSGTTRAILGIECHQSLSSLELNWNMELPSRNTHAHSQCLFHHSALDGVTSESHTWPQGDIRAYQIWQILQHIRADQLVTLRTWDRLLQFPPQSFRTLWVIHQLPRRRGQCMSSCVCPSAVESKRVCSELCKGGHPRSLLIGLGPCVENGRERAF